MTALPVTLLQPGTRSCKYFILSLIFSLRTCGCNKQCIQGQTFRVICGCVNFSDDSQYGGKSHEGMMHHASLLFFWMWEASYPFRKAVTVSGLASAGTHMNEILFGEHLLGLVALSVMPSWATRLVTRVLTTAPLRLRMFHIVPVDRPTVFSLTPLRFGVPRI